MRLAVMQPYIFPYIGYFQLIKSADKFVFLDDVGFIKQGWINRNNLNGAGKPQLFSIPIVNQSSNKPINETFSNPDPRWKKKLLKTIKQNYAKAKNFESVIKLVDDVLMPGESICELATKSIQASLAYIYEENFEFELSSSFDLNKYSGQDRIIAMCELLEANEYVNASGGTELYSHETFDDSGIDLKFIKSLDIQYEQVGSNDFVANLSIIDLMMNCEKQELQEFLNKYELVVKTE